MTTENDHFIIWMIYLTASLGALVVVWRLSLLLSNTELRKVIMLCFMAILWTPARLEPGASHWVPAFMAALMEFISIGSDAAISRSLPIMFVMITLLCLSFLWFLYKRKTGRATQETI